MKTYRVSLQRDISDPRECRVTVVQDGRGTAVRLDALSVDHAKKVASDLVQLLRSTSPEDSIVLDTYVEAEPADAERFTNLLAALLRGAEEDELDSAR